MATTLGYLLLLSAISLVKNVHCLVGGSDAVFEEFPWMGSLRNPDTVHVCGLALGQRNWVLTAAHCVGGIGYTLEFGHIYRYGGYVYSYDAIVRHPSYGVGAGNYANDIALIHVPNDGVSIEHLYIEALSGFDSGTDRTGQTCWTSGWGATTNGGEITMKLQKAVTPVISDADCSNLWSDSYNSAVHVCTWNSASQDTALCQYDDGGPLVCNNQGVWELVGLASWYGPQCETSLPSVFVRVSAFRDWVCAVTSNELCW